MSQALLIEIRGHVLTIGLNRPEKRNAFDVDMYLQLAGALGELHRNPELRVGVVYAVGEHFTGGLDLPKWAPVFASGGMPTLPEGGIDPCGLQGERLKKPLIYALQGTCLTIGIELMLAADIRIAASNTQFGQIEVKRGIYAVGGATVRWLQEIGWGNAMRYLLTGDLLNAAEAHRMGLLTRQLRVELPGLTPTLPRWTKKTGASCRGKHSMRGENWRCDCIGRGNRSKRLPLR